jgi:hypothetical protein
MIAPCSICGKPTEYLCADCAIDKHESVRVCESPKCRDEHEAKNHSKVGT